MKEVVKKKHYRHDWWGYDDHSHRQYDDSENFDAFWFYDEDNNFMNIDLHDDPSEEFEDQVVLMFGQEQTYSKSKIYVCKLKDLIEIIWKKNT